MAPSGARIVPGLSRRIALAMGVGARADAGAKRLYPAEGGGVGVGLDVVVVIAAAGAASRDRRRSAAGETALNAASSLECTEANHERTSSSTSSRVGDSDGTVLGVSAGWAWSEKTFAGVFAGVGCVSLFPGVHAAAAATTAAAAAAFLTVGEKAPPVLAPSSKKSSAAPISAWKAVGEAERTGERRGAESASRLADRRPESAAPGVEPAPTELKERSSTRKLPSASGAGVFGVAVGALVERGESAKRLGRVGVECMARLMFSARSTVLGESGIMTDLRGVVRSATASLSARVGFSLLTSNTRVCCDEGGRMEEDESAARSSGRANSGRVVSRDNAVVFPETRRRFSRRRSHLEVLVPDDAAAAPRGGGLHGRLHDVRLAALAHVGRACAARCGTRCGEPKMRKRERQLVPP